MGYSGLKTYVESDGASDLAYNIMVKAALPLLQAELEKKDNEFNTDGAVNVALYFRSFICPLKYVSLDDFITVAQSAIKAIETMIEEADEYHQRNYDLMIVDLREWIEYQNSLLKLTP